MRFVLLALAALSLTACVVEPAHFDGRHGFDHHDHY